MWGDEYLYQQLGYKHVAARLEDVTDEDIERDAVHISKIPTDIPTQEDIEEYNQFRKTNYDLQMAKSDGFFKAYIIVAQIILTFMFVKGVVVAIQSGKIYWVIYFTGFALLYIVGLVRVFGILKKRTHVEKPIGVTYGYLAKSSTKKSVERIGGRNYSTVTEYHSFSDIWIEKEDKFLRKIPQSLYAFRYNGKKYHWSELVYTPVKIYVFPEYRLEVMPAYAEFKNGKALSTGEKNEQ